MDKWYYIFHLKNFGGRFSLVFREKRMVCDYIRTQLNGEMTDKVKKQLREFLEGESCSLRIITGSIFSGHDFQVCQLSEPPIGADV